MQRQGAGHTLQPTALVNEAWLRLIDHSETGWEGRSSTSSAWRRRRCARCSSITRGGGAPQKRGGSRRARRRCSTPAVLSLEPGVDLLALAGGARGRLEALRPGPGPGWSSCASSAGSTCKRGRAEITGTFPCVPGRARLAHGSRMRSSGAWADPGCRGLNDPGLSRAGFSVRALFEQALRARSAEERASLPRAPLHRGSRSCGGRSRRLLAADAAGRGVPRGRPITDGPALPNPVTPTAGRAGRHADSPIASSWCARSPSGGMGTVYEALQRQRRSVSVALKMMHFGARPPPPPLRRFRLRVPRSWPGCATRASPRSTSAGDAHRRGRRASRRRTSP